MAYVSGDARTAGGSMIYKLSDSVTLRIAICLAKYADYRTSNQLLVVEEKTAPVWRGSDIRKLPRFFDQLSIE